MNGPLPFALADVETGTAHSSPLRARYAFRTGTLEILSEEGKEAIASLSMRKIFDLRTTKEIKHRPGPKVLGIEVIWKDNVAINHLHTKPALQGANAQASSVEARDESGNFLTNMYIDMLMTHKPPFLSASEYIRDHPD